MAARQSSRLPRRRSRLPRLALALLLVAPGLPLASLSSAALAAPAAVRAPATAPPPGLSARDRQVGAEAYGEIVQEFGGTVDGPLADYVRRVATKIALVSAPGSTAADWRVTVLNSPIPNAMATPGGYLYITRGLLAMIDNEAELAAVLGHEAGHVAAKHSDKRNSRATIGALGSVAAAILLGGDAASLVNTGANAWVAGYSRSQENQADSLGMRYAAAAGYDPMAAATMLQALDRVGIVEGQQDSAQRGQNSIFATHPVTADRVRRVAAEAAQLPRGGALDADAFLNAIRGMAYGDTADQGVVSGSSFRHGTLQLGFDAPTGFTLQNGADAVSGRNANGAQFSFTDVAGQPNQTLADVVRSVWQSTAGRMPTASYQERRVNQFDAALSVARLTVNRRQMDVGVNVYRAAADRYYVLQTMAPAGQGSQFDSLVNSVRQLAAQDVPQGTRGRHIEVVTVRAGDTAQSLAGRMAPPYNRVESLLALNGLQNQPLRPGERLKLIVD